MYAAGEDPLAQVRQALIQKLFGAVSQGVSARIVEAIIEDAGV